MAAPPPGWTVIPAPSALAMVTAPGAQDAHATAGVDAFAAPGDPSTTLVVMHAFTDWRADPSAFVQGGLDGAAQRFGRAPVASTSTAHGGVAIGELVDVAPDGVHHHVQLTAAWATPGERLEVVTAVCTGRAPAFTACEAQLPRYEAVADAPPAASSPLPWMIGGAVGFVAVAMTVFFVARWLRARALRRSSALVDHALATVTGVVRPVDAPLEAPLSGLACVLHRSRARVFEPDGTGRLAGEPSERAAVPFALATPRGVVHLDASAATIDLVPRPLVDLDVARATRFLDRLAVPAAQRRSAGFDEIVVAPGDTITVRGMVRLEQDPAAAGERGYRDGAPTVAQLIPSADHPIAILRVWPGSNRAKARGHHADDRGEPQRPGDDDRQRVDR